MSLRTFIAMTISSIAALRMVSGMLIAVADVARVVSFRPTPDVQARLWAR
jgi:hypothetical protein